MQLDATGTLDAIGRGAIFDAPSAPSMLAKPVRPRFVPRDSTANRRTGRPVAAEGKSARPFRLRAAMA